MPKDALTPKQQRFVEEYLIDLNATQAAIRAGYSESTARQIGAENLTKPVIAQAVEAARAKVSETTALTREWVLDRLQENVGRAMQVEAVVDREGNETGEYQYQGSVANRGLELLGKHLGMFTEKVDHTVTVLQPEERQQRLAALLEAGKTRLLKVG